MSAATEIYTHDDQSFFGINAVPLIRMKETWSHKRRPLANMDEHAELLYLLRSRQLRKQVKNVLENFQGQKPDLPELPDQSVPYTMVLKDKWLPEESCENSQEPPAYEEQLPEPEIWEDVSVLRKINDFERLSIQDRALKNLGYDLDHMEWLEVARLKMQIDTMQDFKKHKEYEIERGMFASATKTQNMSPISAPQPDDPVAKTQRDDDSKERFLIDNPLQHNKDQNVKKGDPVKEKIVFNDAEQEIESLDDKHGWQMTLDPIREQISPVCPPIFDDDDCCSKADHSDQPTNVSRSHDYELSNQQNRDRERKPAVKIPLGAVPLPQLTSHYNPPAAPHPNSSISTTKLIQEPIPSARDPAAINKSMQTSNLPEVCNSRSDESIRNTKQSTMEQRNNRTNNRQSSHSCLGTGSQSQTFARFQQAVPIVVNSATQTVDTAEESTQTSFTRSTLCQTNETSPCVRQAPSPSSKEMTNPLNSDLSASWIDEFSKKEQQRHDNKLLNPPTNFCSWKLNVLNTPFPPKPSIPLSTLRLWRDLEMIGRRKHKMEKISQQARADYWDRELYAPLHYSFDDVIGGVRSSVNNAKTNRTPWIYQALPSSVIRKTNQNVNAYQPLSPLSQANRNQSLASRMDFQRIHQYASPKPTPPGWKRIQGNFVQQRRATK